MSTPALDASLLHAFRVVVASGTISHAAKTLHLSQPAVTAQIHKLEEQCGRPLLVRSRRGVLPTDDGRRLLGYAERVDALLDEVSAAMSAKERGGGELLIAASTTIASYVLPIVIARFTRESGPRHVRVDEANTAIVCERVASSSVPLGLVEGHARASGLRLEPFLDDELVPVVSAEAPVGLRRIKRAADLKSVPILWREHGSGSRAVIDRALKKAVGTRKPHPADLQPGGTEAIKAAVGFGLGVGFLSRWSMRRELESGRFVVLALPDLAIPRVFSWALPAGEVTGVAAQFLRFARARTEIAHLLALR